MLDNETVNILRNLYSQLEEKEEVTIGAPDYDQTQVDIIVRERFLNIIDASTLEGWSYIIRPTYEGKKFLEQIANTKLARVERFISQGQDVLKKEKHIPGPGFIAPEYVNGPLYEKWLSEISIFNERFLAEHPLHDSIKTICNKHSKTVSSVEKLIGHMQALASDLNSYTDTGNTRELEGERRKMAMYDVFISHANADKISYVDELNDSLSKMGINIFYDKHTLEWGDNWKQKILEGVEKAEFAIIIISDNFFGREWTEIELAEFLNRQNQQGQKVILPILHNITVEQLREKYPAIADIQGIVSEKYTCDEIALLFAGQLIKRLKTNNG